MNGRTRPLLRLLLVVGIQLAVLLSIIGFKQYTVWTGETVLLKTEPMDPRDLLGDDFAGVRYEISTLDVRELPGDDEFFDSVYVELEEGSDGYWEAVAIHDDREHSFDGTLIIKGEIDYDSSFAGAYRIDYGIEEIFIPEGAGIDLPTGTGHTVAVEVKVDRFGNAVPRRFFVDGEPFDLERR